MDIAIAKEKYWRQKAAAKKRGIDWHFTFESWLGWWGNDLDRRGPGRYQLSMQRFCDQGPYHPDNVRKGRPIQNTWTWARMRRVRQSLEGKARIEAEIDATPGVSADYRDEDEHELDSMFRMEICEDKWTA